MGAVAVRACRGTGVCSVDPGPSVDIFQVSPRSCLIIRAPLTVTLEAKAYNTGRKHRGGWVCDPINTVALMAGDASGCVLFFGGAVRPGQVLSRLVRGDGGVGNAAGVRMTSSTKVHGFSFIRDTYKTV